MAQKPNCRHVCGKPVLSTSEGCESIYHQEFVPPGQVVNQLYREVLQHLKEEVRQNFRSDGRAGTGWFVVTVCRLKLCQCDSFWLLKAWPRLPYSPDVAACDF